MLVHALLAKVDAGFDEEFLNNFLNNGFDRETIHDPQIRDTFREALAKTIAQGYDSFVHELTLGSLEWEPLVAATTCPVDLLVGEANPVYTPAVLRRYVATRPHLTVIPVPETAHLMLYQNFDRVLAATRIVSR